MASKDNPFTPGPGTRPIYMVGRSMELESIVIAMHRIVADRDEHGLVPITSAPQVINGPRGVGKTVLMMHTKELAKQMGVNIVMLDMDLLTGPEEILARTITPQSRLDKFTDYMKQFKGSLTISEEFNFALGPSGYMVPRDLKGTMAAGSLAGPMAMFLDEAHTVPPERMREFCNAAQYLIASRYPLVLIMAGTPGLLSLLMGMGGTFMERSELLSVNLFSADETREALSKGFEGTGFNVDVDALESLVEWSDCYPYFVQLAGYWAWHFADRDGSDTVTLISAKSGLEMAAERRTTFYDMRRDELMNNGILKEAFQVMDLFAGAKEGLDRTELLDGLRQANRGMDRQGALDIERTMMGLGFLHKNKRKKLEAGIPSLFDYIKANSVEKFDSS